MLYLEGRDNIGLKTGDLVMHQWCSGNMRSSHSAFTVVVMAALRVRLPVDAFTFKMKMSFWLSEIYAHIFVGSFQFIYREPPRYIHTYNMSPKKKKTKKDKNTTSYLGRVSNVLYRLLYVKKKIPTNGQRWGNERV